MRHRQAPLQARGLWGGGGVEQEGVGREGSTLTAGVSVQRRAHGRHGGHEVDGQEGCWYLLSVARGPTKMNSDVNRVTC
jgi:hypothetical protein